MGATGVGKGARPPWKCCKVFFVLQILSKVSVDAAFMHYFEKMSSAAGSFSPDSTGAPPLDSLGDFRLSDPLIVHPEKILRVPMFASK